MTAPGIGSVNESSLHSAIKTLYLPASDNPEVLVDGFIVDAVAGGQIVEIQTSSFSKIKKKLADLLARHRVKLVHPVAGAKTLTVYDRTGQNLLYRRKSPKRGRVIDVVNQLVFIPHLLLNPRFSLEVLLTEEEEVRWADGEGSWRRRGISIVDRKLLGVMDRVTFCCARDYAKLLPPELPPSFTNRVLAQTMDLHVGTVQKLTYCLRNIGLLRVSGRQGNALVFQRVEQEGS